MSEFDNPKRWQPPPERGDLLAGQYFPGINNGQIAILFGQLISQWTHVEDLMIRVLEWLVYVDQKILNNVAKKSRGHTPGNQIFRSIINHGSRIKLMRSLLKRFIGNIAKDNLYDQIIDEFASLGERRNDYAHAKWWTHESGKVFKQSQLVDDMYFGLREEVTIEEFIKFRKDLEVLQDKIRRLSIIEHREIVDEILASLKNPPPLPSENSQ